MLKDDSELLFAFSAKNYVRDVLPYIRERIFFLIFMTWQFLMGSKTGLLLSLPLPKLILGSKVGQKKWKIRFIPTDSKHIRTTYALIKYFIFLKKPMGSSFIILSCINLQIQGVKCHYKYQFPYYST